MNNEITHPIRKRSWWDGSVIAYCGHRAKSGTYRENWFRGGITCPACRAGEEEGEAMSHDNLVHDARQSWWNGDITTLCGLKFKGGKGWRDKLFAISINCPACKRIRKQRK